MSQDSSKPRSGARSAILGISAPAKPAEVVPLRDMSSHVEDVVIDAAASAMAERAGVLEDGTARPPSPPPEPPRRRLVRPVSPIAPHVEMPIPGEIVPWDANLRGSFPRYAFQQLSEYAHRNGCTIQAALLRMMDATRDKDGKPVFFLRAEDMVADRRKVKKPRW